MFQYSKQYFMHVIHALYDLSPYQFLRQQIKWIISCRHQIEPQSIFHHAVTPFFTF
jgi:hypothetical protein